MKMDLIRLYTMVVQKQLLSQIRFMEGISEIPVVLDGGWDFFCHPIGIRRICDCQATHVHPAISVTRQRAMMHSPIMGQVCLLVLDHP